MTVEFGSSCCVGYVAACFAMRWMALGVIIEGFHMA